MDNDLPQRLIQARSILGMSQLDLATRSGVAAAQISRYESGRSRPRAEVVAKLSNGLGVPFEWLLNGASQSSGLEAFQRSPLCPPWAASVEPRSDTASSLEMEPKKTRPMRVFEDPIDVPADELLKLSLQLVSFHAERSALQTVMSRLANVEGHFSVVDGTRRQLEAVEADILDTQMEIRKLVAE